MIFMEQLLKLYTIITGKDAGKRQAIGAELIPTLMDFLPPPRCAYLLSSLL